jgi:hypothetical protein
MMDYILTILNENTLKIDPHGNDTLIYAFRKFKEKLDGKTIKIRLLERKADEIDLSPSFFMVFGDDENE